MPRTRDARLHLYISGPTHRGPDMFLTPQEARQWATTLALASAVAHGEDEGDSAPVEGTVTHDPLEGLILRWRGDSAVAREQASIDKDCGDHEGVARNIGRADAISELLRELEAVIGL